MTGVFGGMATIALLAAAAGSVMVGQNGIRGDGSVDLAAETGTELQTVADGGSLELAAEGDVSTEAELSAEAPLIASPADGTVEVDAGDATAIATEVGCECGDGEHNAEVAAETEGSGAVTVEQPAAEAEVLVAADASLEVGE